MTAWLVFTSAAAAICCAQAVSSGYPVIRTFSAADTGAEVIGLSAVEAENGVMYFGSNSLLKYDGDRWTSHEISGAYGIYGLDIGRDGILWVAAAGEIGWFSPDNGSLRFHSLRARLDPRHAQVGNGWHAFAFRHGAVFTTDDRVHLWNGREMRSWIMEGTRRIRAFKQGQDVFFQHPPTGVYQMSEDGPLPLFSSAEIGTDTIFWLERAESGWLVVTQRGVFRFVGGALHPVGGTTQEFFAANRLANVHRVDEGRLAIGTMDGGIAVVTRDGELESVFDAEAGLGANFVWPICIDRDGALWAGSRSSILRIRLTQGSRVFDHRAGFPLQPAVKLSRHDGRLVLANAQGVYHLDPAHSRFRREFATAGGFFDVRVAEGALLAAGYRGVTRIADGESVQIHSSNADSYALAVSKKSPRNLLIADGNRIVELHPDGSAEELVHDLPAPATSIVEDASGTLWLGTKASGMFAAKRSTPAGGAQRVTAMGIPNPDGPSHVIETTNGAVLLFNRDGGWIRTQLGGGFTRIAGSPPRPVVDTATDGSGTNIWLLHRADATAPTIGRVAIHNETATWEPHFVDDLFSVGVPRSILAESNGTSMTLWIGGTTGVLRHEFSGTPTVPVPRTPIIHAMARTRSGTTHGVTSVPLAASTRGIDFDFAIPEFGRRNALRLETRIDGIDDHWVTVGTNSRRELTSLRAGRYTVRARSVAEAGVTSPETVFTFEVLKPWWQTAPAMVGLGLVVMLSASGAYRLRVRTLRRRNLELEQKVRERTEELERASAAKTEFVANMSHDIRN